MAVDWRSNPQFITELFRYSYFLHGTREGAMNAVEQALKQLTGKPEAKDALRAMRFLFTRIRRTAPALSTGVESGAVALLRAFPEPNRSLAALFYTTTLDQNQLSRILGLPVAELAKRLEIIRRHLGHLLPKPSVVHE